MSSPKRLQSVESERVVFLDMDGVLNTQEGIGLAECPEYFYGHNAELAAPIELPLLCRLAGVLQRQNAKALGLRLS